MSGDTYLVTGGAGFIGSHLVDRLLEAGRRVICLDDFNDFYDPALKREHAAVHRGHGGYRLVEGDIRDRALVERLLRRERPEVIVHLAARAGVRPSLKEPRLYAETNVTGTLNLLEAARQAGTGKFIFGSSSSVYGVNRKVPFAEDDPLLHPVSPYAATKIAGEALCGSYAAVYGLPVITLRFFTVYGPRQRPDLAIRHFAEAMLQGREITLFGDGGSARDYTYIDDIVGGILAAVDYPARGHEIFNLGNASPVELRELVRLLEEALGVRAKIRRAPDQPGDVPVTYAAIEKAGRLLGYRPETPLAEGLQKFARWLAARF
jgi:UDP-glucuronate 4-epimerase